MMRIWDNIIEIESDVQTHITPRLIFHLILSDYTKEICIKYIYIPQGFVNTDESYYRNFRDMIYIAQTLRPPAVPTLTW